MGIKVTIRGTEYDLETVNPDELEEVLDNLSNSRIYRTDEIGSVNFKIYRHKVKIKNYIQ